MVLLFFLFFFFFFFFFFLFFVVFFVVCGFFFKLTFLKNNLPRILSVSNGLALDQARRPELGPNCLQRLSADDKSRH